MGVPLEKLGGGPFRQTMQPGVLHWGVIVAALVFPLSAVAGVIVVVDEDEMEVEAEAGLEVED